MPLFDQILSIIKTPLERLIPDRGERDRFAHELEKELLRAGLAQAEINREEARHHSLFVAGWRPFIGWVCGVSLAWHFMIYDLVNWARAAFFPDMPVPPTLNGAETLLTIVLSLLGLGGLRTVEKLKGVQRDK